MDFKSLMPFGRSTGLARSGTDADPFTSLRREMDRLFEDFNRGWAVPATFGTSEFLSPKVNIAETDKSLEVTADLPGIDHKDIEITLSDDVLTLKAEHKAEKEEKDEKKQYHIVERSFGTFIRSFQLPFEANTDKVEASFDKGVLKISVPRSSASEKQVKKVAIKTSGQERQAEAAETTSVCLIPTHDFAFNPQGVVRQIAYRRSDRRQFYRCSRSS